MEKVLLFTSKIDFISGKEEEYSKHWGKNQSREKN
jgi:hypothetical protein